MLTTITKPDDHAHWLQLRTQDVTSTEVSCLFNLNPYQTKFELWHRKKSGQTGEFQVNERMKWGSRLEAAIATGIAEDQGWVIEPMKSYARIAEYRIGSSFDYFIGDDGILEIKNVDSLVFKNQWQPDDDGAIECPPHIEMQVQQQLLISGRKYAYIGVLVGGNDIKLIKREPMPDVHKAIIKKAKEFWQSIKDNGAPSPDFERDAQFIKSLYQHAEPDKEIEPTPRIDQLTSEYKLLGDTLKDVTSKMDGVKAELLTLIGDAERCRGKQYTISAGVVGETQINYTRRAYRNMRISFKKEKLNE